jgi:hypothetical protein
MGQEEEGNQALATMRHPPWRWTGGPDALGPERHAALEAIDQEKAVAFLGDDEREAGVQDLEAPIRIAELEGYLLDEDLANAHGFSLGWELGGIERIW